MGEVKQQLWYTDEHEWVQRTENGTVRIGITDFAQHQLGDIVFVELPEAGATIEQGAEIGTIESVKTVSDLFAPVTGTILKVNETLESTPELVNESPYEKGWMIEVEMDKDVEEALGKLLSADQYEQLISDEQ
ncbi:MULTISPECIES: glycine cleavage system protein GcvH [Paenibacillus]|jgi:glycine cleavage system H protein|uniref:Glycine cleavage system H protein n=2 Tax=Paenibacillus TaxID=44249 RepID=A0AAJ3IV18_PAEPO|nr:MULTISPECIES: glycine cleavage system protein GcvH [Paenibacillus]AIW41171.1 glycine cleavage system protein H [Paenibacillus polymyxa CR1]ALA43432.1 glycine cleavage system protein H [Paenibacillus peoriae]APB74774.1 glycine cleavage system protein H [Paenibacillus polymyxa]APQ60725.1 glycine cleavage system protein H [Paenibacillus polymyxa]MBP1177751.1 glycine cleavage system H protein [Paenibacillus sp. PvR133]